MEKQYIEFQKKVADNIYEILDGIGTDLLLIGGAPRNWFFGHGAKDLDFYMTIHDLKYFIENGTTNDPQKEFDQYIKDILYEIRFIFDKVQDFRFNEDTFKIHNNYSGEDFHPDIEYVINVKIYGIDIQVILGHSSRNTITHNFISNICRIAYVNGEIIPTNEFLDAVDTKTIRFNGIKQSIREQHMVKLFKYFPNWTFIDHNGKIMGKYDKLSIEVKYMASQKEIR